MTQLYFVLLTILGIGFLVFIHEAGHYLCARLAGVRVLVFSIGFGPRLFGAVRNGTDYRVSLVPVGGYVRVAGEDPVQREQLAADDLHAKGVGARALFFSGGVLMNLLFAVVCFPVVFRAGVQFTAPVVGPVAVGSPAWIAGLEPGDRIAQVHGKSMYSFDNLLVELALAGDRDVELEVERNGSTRHVYVHPVYDETAGVYGIGIGQPAKDKVTIDVDPEAPAYAAGLRTGDALLAVDGTAVNANALEPLQGGFRFAARPVEVQVVRGAEPLKVTFTPGMADLPRPLIGVFPAARRVAGIKPGAAAVDALDLRRGDHIVAVDGRRFTGGSLEPFALGPDAMTMKVLRGEPPQLVELHAAVSAEERSALASHVALAVDRAGTAVDPQAGSPAAAAGLRAGDTVLAIDGTEIADWSELQSAVQRAGAGPIRMRVDTGDGVVERTVDPAQREADLGFRVQLQPLLEPYHKDTAAAAIAAGAVCSVDLIKSLYVTLKKVFTGEVAAKNLGGIITISRVTYAVAQSGWERFLYFLALLSINLAFINVLPIPAFDGGHLLFVFIEGIKGSPVNPKVMNYSQVLGLVFIVALLVFVTYNDILRLL